MGKQPSQWHHRSPSRRGNRVILIIPVSTPALYPVLLPGMAEIPVQCKNSQSLYLIRYYYRQRRQQNVRKLLLSGGAQTQQSPSLHRTNIILERRRSESLRKLVARKHRQPLSDVPGARDVLRAAFNRIRKRGEAVCEICHGELAPHVRFILFMRGYQRYQRTGKWVGNCNQLLPVVDHHVNSPDHDVKKRVGCGESCPENCGESCPEKQLSAAAGRRRSPVKTSALNGSDSCPSSAQLASRASGGASSSAHSAARRQSRRSTDNRNDLVQSRVNQASRKPPENESVEYRTGRRNASGISSRSTTRIHNASEEVPREFTDSAAAEQAMHEQRVVPRENLRTPFEELPDAFRAASEKDDSNDPQVLVLPGWVEMPIRWAVGNSDEIQKYVPDRLPKDKSVVISRCNRAFHEGCFERLGVYGEGARAVLLGGGPKGTAYVCPCCCETETCCLCCEEMPRRAGGPQFWWATNEEEEVASGRMIDDASSENASEEAVSSGRKSADDERSDHDASFFVKRSAAPMRLKYGVSYLWGCHEEAEGGHNFSDDEVRNYASQGGLGHSGGGNANSEEDGDQPRWSNEEDTSSRNIDRGSIGGEISNRYDERTGTNEALRHKFCRGCTENWREGMGRNDCPLCRKVVIPKK